MKEKKIRLHRHIMLSFSIFKAEIQPNHAHNI